MRWNHGQTQIRFCSNNSIFIIIKFNISITHFHNWLPRKPHFGFWGNCIFFSRFRYFDETSWSGVYRMRWVILGRSSFYQWVILGLGRGGRTLLVQVSLISLFWLILTEFWLINLSYKSFEILEILQNIKR